MESFPNEIIYMIMKHRTCIAHQARIHKWQAILTPINTKISRPEKEYSNGSNGHPTPYPYFGKYFYNHIDPPYWFYNKYGRRKEWTRYYSGKEAKWVLAKFRNTGNVMWVDMHRRDETSILKTY